MCVYSKALLYFLFLGNSSNIDLRLLVFTEPSEDAVIEYLGEFKQLGFDKLQAVINRSTHMITDAYSETVAGAANENKKLEVIFTVLSHTVRRQLAIFLEELKSEILHHVEHHKGIVTYT